MAHITPHQIGAAHLYQLAAAQHANGLEIVRHNARNGGLSGARIACKDHVHIRHGHRQPCGTAAALGGHIVGQRAHIFLHRRQPHHGIQLCFSLCALGGKHAGQQACDRDRFSLGFQHRFALLFCAQRDLGTGCRAAGELVLCQRPVQALCLLHNGRHALRLGVNPCQPIPQGSIGAQLQFQSAAAILRKAVQFPCRNGLQRFRRIGRRGAGIPNVLGKARTKRRCKFFRLLRAKKYQIFSLGGQLAYGAPCQCRAAFHQNAFLQKIAAVQRCCALLHQRRKRCPATGRTFGPPVKGNDLARGRNGAVQILQKQFFLCRARI